MSVEEVATNVYRLEDDDGGRALCQFVVAGRTRALVVDTGLPGSPLTGILPLLDELGIGNDPLVLLTHPDADHCGGTGTLVAARPASELIVNAPDAGLFGNPEQTIAERYQPFAVSDGIVATQAALSRMRARLGQPYRITRRLDWEEQADIGGRHCRILLVPGHSRGHGAAWLPDMRILIAGDAVMGRGIRNLDGSLLYAPQFFSPTAYRKTIERIQSLDVDLLLCAHEPPRAGRAVAEFLMESLAALDELKWQVGDALAKGDTNLAGICASVHDGYGDLPTGRSADLATSVAGILVERATAGSVAIDDSVFPRQFTLVSR
jgi:glyoxylase-like metal-dependent hydrolase (beta-lactamase superfamily II)